MPLILAERDDPVAVVLLNRPEALNALSDELMNELVATLTELDRDEAVLCIVLGGSERAFAAGADIGELAGSSAIDLYYQRRVERWDAIRSLWTPLVAAVSGFCLGGGCELAMSCDLIVASETAQFGQPETSLGIIPGAGGTQRLGRLVGPGRAAELVLSGRVVAADEAARIGLANVVTEASGLMARSRATAAEIAAKAPRAVAAAKRAIRAGDDAPMRQALAEERRLFSELFSTHDQKEGMHAFVEKRPPVWTGT